MRLFQETEEEDTADDNARAVVSGEDMWDLKNLASLRTTTSALAKHDEFADLSEDLLDRFFQFEDNAASSVPVSKSEALEFAVEHAVGDD